MLWRFVHLQPDPSRMCRLNLRSGDARLNSHQVRHRSSEARAFSLVIRLHACKPLNGASVRIVVHGLKLVRAQHDQVRRPVALARRLPGVVAWAARVGSPDVADSSDHAAFVDDCR